MSIVGLGGMGKTQVALQFAYEVKEAQPEWSIFWLPAVSMESFEQACAGIVQALHISQRRKEEDDPKELVKQYLSSSRARRWLLVVDNADDPNILFGGSEQSGGIVDYLPESEGGVTVYTTRTVEVAVSLTRGDVLELGAMDRGDAIDFLSESLVRKELLRNQAMTDKLLDELTCLPLAIAQAAAYLNMNRTTITRYLWLLHNTEQDLVSLVSEEFRDDTRYEGSANAMATTWIVSFSQLRERHAVAADLLRFMSCVEWKAIPRSLLPEAQSEGEMEKAIGTLCGYSFLARRDGDNQATSGGSRQGRDVDQATEAEEWYDMHRLVHLATRIWVKEHGNASKVAEDAVRRVADVFPSDDYKNQAMWRGYLPHALRLLSSGQHSSAWEQSKLCLLVGRCLRVDGRIREAVVWLERSCQERSQLSEDNPGRLSSQHILAGAYEADGQVHKAVALLEHVVEVKEKMLAAEHPSRLASQHALAGAYEADGQEQKAALLFNHVRLARTHSSESFPLDQDPQLGSHAAWQITQEEPSVRSATLVEEQDGYTAEKSSATDVMEPEREGDDECMSMESNHEDIASQIATRRSLPEILAVRQFGSFFAELEDLRSLHKEALSRLGTTRFQENYRRIFKRYVLQLQGNARIPVEKDIVLILRSRTNRLNMAQRILNLIQTEEEGLSKPFEGLICQPVEKLQLEDWAKNVYTSQNPESLHAIEVDAEGSEHPGEESDGEESDGEESDGEESDGEESDGEESDGEVCAEEQRFPTITQANRFLRTGFPFQMLVQDLRLLVLPRSIREVVEHTPKDSIRLFSENDTSLINKFKAFFEDSSNIEWDWWPLTPRVPDLPSDKMHLRWTVSVLFATTADLIVSLIYCSFVGSTCSWRSLLNKPRYCSTSWNFSKIIRQTVIVVSYGLFQVIGSLPSAACTG
jgi:tetratricopeptide (TPR) repeat protein